MHLHVFPDYQSLSRATADLIARFIQQKPDALVCLASGHTPLGVFECLVQDVRNNSLDIRGCTFVGLDEWMGMNGDDVGSCRHMMDEAFFNPLQIPGDQIVFFDGRSANTGSEVDFVNRRIDRNHGLDIMLVGIGTNGHIAMNEPGTSFATKAHISILAEETKSVGQKYFTTATPLDKGITLGLQNFADARLPILLANGSKKSAIIKRVLTEEVSEQLPASIVQKMPHAYVMLDDAAHADYRLSQ